MEKTMTNLECSCGCQLFTDFRPFTIDADTFMVWNFKENIKPSKITVPVVQCVACGKILPPRASFGGRNMLDEEVQLYAKLLEYTAARNVAVDKANLAVTAEAFKDIGVCNCGTIETSPVGEEGVADVVDTVKPRGGTRKADKK
jgi:hypothetical protein